MHSPSWGRCRRPALASRLPAAQPSVPRPEGANPIAVTSSPATTKALPILRSSVGWIESAARVTVRARMDGAIVERHVRDGAEVAAGDILFRLDDRELRAQIARGDATLARDRAVLFKLQGQATRAQSLLIRNVGTQAQAEEAVANVKNCSRGSRRERSCAGDRTRQVGSNDNRGANEWARRRRTCAGRRPRPRLGPRRRRARHDHADDATCRVLPDAGARPRAPARHPRRSAPEGQGVCNRRAGPRHQRRGRAELHRFRRSIPPRARSS